MLIEVPRGNERDMDHVDCHRVISSECSCIDGEYLIEFTLDDADGGMEYNRSFKSSSARDKAYLDFIDRINKARALSYPTQRLSLEGIGKGGL